jgi:hypothetical protein
MTRIANEEQRPHIFVQHRQQVLREHLMRQHIPQKREKQESKTTNHTPKISVNQTNKQ